MPISFSGTLVRSDLAEAVFSTQLEDGFIWNRVFPPAPVTRPDGKISLITRKSIMQTIGTGYRRASGGSYPRLDAEVSQVAYSCDDYGFEHPIDDKDRSKYTSEMNVELVASRIAAYNTNNAIEGVVAGLLFNTTTFTGSALYTDLSAQPWATSSTTILKHVLDARATMISRGVKPNKLVVPFSVWVAMQRNEELLSAALGTGPVTTLDALRAAMARVLEVDEILVGEAHSNTQGSGTYTGASTWNASYAMLCVSSDDLSMPSIGRTFIDSTRGAAPFAVTMYREDPRSSDIVQVFSPAAPTLIDASFGMLLKVA